MGQQYGTRCRVPYLRAVSVSEDFHLVTILTRAPALVAVNRDFRDFHVHVMFGANDHFGLLG